jgi:hypothetical protein
MKAWTFRVSLCLSLLWVASLGAHAHADERCVLRFNRDEIDIVRGEIRIDLNRRIQRECRGLSAGNIRLDQVTVELRDDRRSRDDRRDDWRDDRSRRGRGGDTVPVYRFYDGRRHLMTDDPDEGARFGNDEGVSFELYRSGGGNRKAVYRCATSRGDRFLSLDSRCEGHSNEGQLGFIASSPEGADSRPVYRCFNGKLADHIATTDQNECAAARYGVEFTLGYVR